MADNGPYPDVHFFARGRAASDRWTTFSVPEALLEKTFYAYSTIGGPQ